MTEIAPEQLPASLAVPPAPRYFVLDVLRGFALFGILIVNIAIFARPCYLVFTEHGVFTGDLNGVLSGLVRVFAEGKFITLFCLLFGIGFGLQMERWKDTGQASRRFRRRLAGLLMIGLIHALLIWEGDVLVTYALIGYVLLLFRNRRPMTLLVWGGGIVVLLLSLYWAGAWAWWLATRSPEMAGEISSGVAFDPAEMSKLADENIEAFRHGSYADIFQQRLRNLAFYYSFSWLYVPQMIALFLLGTWCVRSGFLQDLASRTLLLRRWAVVGAAVGFAFSGVELLFEWLELTESPLYLLASMTSLSFGAPLLGLAYGAAICLLVLSGRCSLWCNAFAAVGKMSLSNYLFQSLVCTTIFYSYGLGLYATLSVAQELMIALAVFTVQVGLSIGWSKRFRTGPAEWLWRRWTYREV